jgi:hypothetical protein
MELIDGLILVLEATGIAFVSFKLGRMFGYRAGLDFAIKRLKEVHEEKQ